MDWTDEINTAVNEAITQAINYQSLMHIDNNQTIEPNINEIHSANTEANDNDLTPH